MDELNNEIRKIYGNDPRNTKIQLPKCVTERLDWVSECIEEGLTFYGGFMAVLAYEEDQAREDFELGGTWLPVSDEFKAWRDEGYTWRLKEMQIALALIYAYEEVDDEE